MNAREWQRSTAEPTRSPDSSKFPNAGLTPARPVSPRQPAHCPVLWTGLFYGPFRKESSGRVAVFFVYRATGDRIAAR